MGAYFTSLIRILHAGPELRQILAVNQLKDRSEWIPFLCGVSHHSVVGGNQLTLHSSGTREQLTKPSSGISSLVYCLGRLFMVASALGTPVDSRQLMSFSFSLSYSCGVSFLVAYNLQVGFFLVGLLEGEAVLEPVG